MVELKTGRPPKYQRILAQLSRIIERKAPGTRLPTVRQLMAEYAVSQAAIERCLDELVRCGQVRRERCRGLYVDGVQPKTNVIGVYTDADAPSHSNSLFIDGVRAAAARLGFRAADFGPHDRFHDHAELRAALQHGLFSGIIAALSTGGLMNIENDQRLAKLLRENRVPLVSCLPVPAVRADSVTPDYFTVFEKVGRYLRRHAAGPVLFLGHQGILSLARTHGLRAGLGPGFDFRSELVESSHGGAYGRMRELKRKGWRGSLVLGVPPDQPGEVTALQGVPWRAGSGNELVVVLEATQKLPPDVSAHVVIRPSFRMGEAAAALIVRRLRGFRGEMCQTVIRHEVRMAGANR